MSTLHQDPVHITLAVQAMGGQGGGVLVNWLVALAEGQGWTASATSVAGVAQRTGATIYYVELVSPTPGREPVLALMPVPGQVDVLIAAELMEAGRAVDRGLVTPDRTTLIASTHRTFAVSEKIVPGNGVLDATVVYEALQASAKSCVLHDFQTLAVQQGSVISASLFGALAGSGALPFAKSEFETVISNGDLGVQASLGAFNAAYALAQDSTRNAPVTQASTPVLQPRSMQTSARALPEPQSVHSPAVRALVERIRREFPAPAWDLLGEGVARLVDWQNVAYASQYLDHVSSIARHDVGSDSCPEGIHSDTPSHELTLEAAQWIAVAMSYDDVIRVADLKTRAERHARLRDEVQAGNDDVVGSQEYFHPRIEEVRGLLPVAIARTLDRHPTLKAWLGGYFSRGRRIRSHTLWGFLVLRIAASLRRVRFASLRHAEETEHLNAWLAIVTKLVPTQAALATEVLRCRRLIKGYSDTHSRGQSRFDALMHAANLLQGQSDAAHRLARLRQAALQDASGAHLRKEWLDQGLPSHATPQVQTA